MAVARSENELQALGLDYVVADLGTPDGCKLAVEETQNRLGPAAILVCNHGIGSAHERVIWEQEPELWHETMRINLDGPYFLSRIVVKDMIEQCIS
jgi:NAD(P)-dependent dehydrogenase (short-subunit alcohol dehydrogenase family)